MILFLWFSNTVHWYPKKPNTLRRAARWYEKKLYKNLLLLSLSTVHGRIHLKGTHARRSPSLALQNELVTFYHHPVLSRTKAGSCSSSSNQEKRNETHKTIKLMAATGSNQQMYYDCTEIQKSVFCSGLPPPISRCLKITEKVSHSTLRAKRAYSLSGQKLIKSAKNGPFWRIFENLKLAAKQCYQTNKF